jgi:energy-coupling factor transport system ATP-binding protein
VNADTNSIIISNLTFKYLEGTSFEKTALCDISLNIRKGEFIGLIGHTGSGKSTLVQHFNGLLKPTSGTVIINGKDVSGKNLKELRRQVGIIFQYPEHQLFEETVYDDIAFGLTRQGIDKEIIKQKVEKMMDIVGLERGLMKTSPFELSGGQKRRAAIAGVLVMEPSILVLDEPTAGLDPIGRDEIFGFIKNLHEETKNTVILVSHSMEDVAKLVERVVVMNKGKIELDGTPTEIFRDCERLEKLGLSVPQITYLMKKLKSRFPEINEDIFTVREAKEEILKFL